MIRATRSISSAVGVGCSADNVCRNDNRSSSWSAPYRAVKSVNSPEGGGRANARCRMSLGASVRAEALVEDKDVM